MTLPGSHKHASQAPDPTFYSTQWSLVLTAADAGEQGNSAALAELCQRYWYPLYVYARRQQTDTHAAQDLVQGFFLHLLAQGALAKADQQRGRFRSFLLTAFKNYRTNQWKKEQAQRRGGGVRPLPLDFEAGESLLRQEPCDHLTPERQYERQWTLTLLKTVTLMLAREMATAGKADQFECLMPILQGPPEIGFYETVAAELDSTPAAVKQAAHRLKKRFREVVRAEVGKTVADPAEIDEELRSLLAALG